ncbi:MAG: CRISPR-associated ring nuclease Csm6, partial [Desulfohalobiaceae bacterium]
QADNSRLADGIVYIVRSLCERPETMVHASLAGGRKTMSFYLGMAMQLFARNHDQLSHVLVRPPFENHPEFFYPPCVPRDYTVFNPISGQPYTVNSAEAKIELAMIPFVRLRDFTPGNESEMGFPEQISSVQNALQNVCPRSEIVFQEKNLLLWVGDQFITLTPTEAGIYLLLLKTKMDCEQEDCIGCLHCYLNPYDLQVDFIEEFLRSRWGRWSERAEGINLQNKQGHELKSWFLQHRSRINRKIKAIDPTGQALIVSAGGYGEKRYGIGANKQMLTWS